MTIPILLVSRGPAGDWWRHTALMRSDVDITTREDYDSAYAALLTGYWRRFVVDHQPEDDGMPMFLWRVRVSEWTAPPQCLLVTADEDPSLRQPPVAAVVRPPVQAEEFDRALAPFVDMPVRSCCRVAVSLRVHGVGAQGRGVSGTTVDLSSGGMLVRADRALPIGERVSWTFEGVSPLTGLSLPGTVLRSRVLSGPSSQRAYAVRFDDRARKQIESVKRFLKDRGHR